MKTSASTVAHIYVKEGETLHILSQTPYLRVRWLKQGRWFLRWDAVLDDEGRYQSLLQDGVLADCDDQQLLAIMASTAATMNRWHAPDLQQELEQFVVD